jgi:hypothetical protein
MPPQGWSQPQASNNSYLVDGYPTTYGTHQTNVVPRLVVTPMSDTTLHSASRISPASTNNALPSPGTVSSNTPTRPVLMHPSKRGSKPTPTKHARKRQKSETDDDDDEDVLSASIDTNVPRPNPNRL